MCVGDGLVGGALALLLASSLRCCKKHTEVLSSKRPAVVVGVRFPGTLSGSVEFLRALGSQSGVSVWEYTLVG